MRTDLISLVDGIRIDCDALIQHAVAIKTSVETTLAWRELQLAKCWLGKLKQALGDTSPYLPATEAKDIPKPQEQYEGELLVPTGNKLADVNTVRALIQKTIDKVFPLVAQFSNRDMGTNELEYCLQHLHEARFWYGFELAEMRNKA